MTGGKRCGASLCHALYFLLLVALLAGCGQVITVSPTPTAQPTPTIAIAVGAATEFPTPTPAPYTPAPTPTPTITPTPVLHSIGAGQSLLVIANQYGLSVAALQEANGILDPRTLQIGQQLIIPREEELDETSNTTSTPTPVPLEIENVHFSESSIGGLWVLGEVVNPNDFPLEQVRVGVALTDAAENDITQASALVALDLLDPDERSPFAVLFGEAPDAFERYRTFPLSAVPAYVGSYYRDLEIRDLEYGGQRYAANTVNGTIYNFGPEEAVSVQVILTAYDPLNRVIAMRTIDPEYNVVPPGGETQFTAVLAPVGGPIARVVALAQGRRISVQQ